MLPPAAELSITKNEPLTEDLSSPRGISRRICGCIHSRGRLKRIIKSKIPEPPPPSPKIEYLQRDFPTNYVLLDNRYIPSEQLVRPTELYQPKIRNLRPCVYANMEPVCVPLSNVVSQMEPNVKVLGTTQNKWWDFMYEMVSLIQLSVTATALAIYYIIFCYMQLIYYTLRTAVYFHNSDILMKISITIVTVTALILGLQFVTQIDRLLGL